MSGKQEADTRRAAADRLTRAAHAAGDHPAADALHALAEDVLAAGEDEVWGPVADALESVPPRSAVGRDTPNP